MTDPNRLEQIKARLAAATPGPWRVGSFKRRSDIEPGRIDRYFGDDTVLVEDRVLATLNWAFEKREADAELIAHAPADIAWLLDALTTAVEALKLVRARCCDYCEAEGVCYPINDALAKIRGAT